jgi:type VI secretion system protein ImpB
MVHMDFVELMEDLRVGAEGVQSSSPGSRRKEAQRMKGTSHASRKQSERSSGEIVRRACRSPTRCGNHGSPTTIELPFVMGVILHDLSAHPDQGSGKRSGPPFVETDANRFPAHGGARTACESAREEYRCRRKVPSGTKNGVDLTFSRMGDFAPDKIAEQVPQLAEILKMRRQLEELLGFMDSRVDAEKRIANFEQPAAARPDRSQAMPTATRANNHGRTASRSSRRG